MTQLANLMISWGSFYANHAAARTLVAFVHIAALIVGGGIAIAADRSTLHALRQDAPARRVQLEALHGTHRLVIAALALVAISGVLLFASDFETFLYSRFFWIKMGLVALLVINGALVWRAERRAISGDAGAWSTLHVTAIASIALWLLTTLGGVALPNIG
jgi:uncharacterized membrane protein